MSARLHFSAPGVGGVPSVVLVVDRIKVGLPLSAQQQEQLRAAAAKGLRPLESHLKRKVPALWGVWQTASQEDRAALHAALAPPALPEQVADPPAEEGGGDAGG